MQKPYKPSPFELEEIPKKSRIEEPQEPITPDGESKDFNEPQHYHTQSIDTIKFLQEGFLPQVFAYFCIGNIIKYLQRFEHKNGMEDLMKAHDYMNRLFEFAKEKKLGK